MAKYMRIASLSNTPLLDKWKAKSYCKDLCARNVADMQMRLHALSQILDSNKPAQKKAIANSQEQEPHVITYMHTHTSYLFFNSAAT